MRSFLQRMGAASPLVPAAAYSAVAVVANLIATLAPEQPLLLLIALLGWATAGVLFLVTVTWFRTDDWLAAGFLIAITFLVSSAVSNIVAAVIVQRSVGPAIAGAPGMMLGVVIRGVIGVPVFGGVVALMRWLTLRWRSSPGAPAA